MKVTSAEGCMRGFIGAMLEREHVPREPAPLSPAQQEAFLRGVDLYNACAWWEAHEAWEGVWIDLKAGARPGEEARVMQGLIQCAALLFNHRRGTTRGVRNQWIKLQPKLEGWTSAWGVDVPTLLDRLRPFAEDADACERPYVDVGMPMMEDEA